MKPSRVFALSLLVVAVCSTVLSNTSTRRTRAASRQTKKAYARNAADATITGTISFKGEAPARRQISMDADPACTYLNPGAETEDIFVSDGKLANVFVYVKGGPLEEYEFAVPTTPAVLEHRKCQYSPHLLGIQAGQPMRIVNADPTTHNTHPSPSENDEWNRSQPAGAEPMEITGFTRPEIIPFKCNQHPWERAYVGVFSHPFFAISGKDGTFRIEGLPPGDYTLVAWHEKFGPQEMQVTVVPYQLRVVDFTFKHSDMTGR